MIKLEGKYNTADVFTDNIDLATEYQIVELLDQYFTRYSKIKIMPDCHKGNGCVIGTTMTITEEIVPNLVGVDIGCGILTAKLIDKEINLEVLDKIIHMYIPSGFNVHKGSINEFSLKNLFYQGFNQDLVNKSLGTLGGGNHFIEVDKDDEGNLYLLIHSGSRNIGKQVADYYQKLAIQQRKDSYNSDKLFVIGLSKENREEDLIQERLDMIIGKPNDPLCYLTGDLMEKYLHDMRLIQNFARLNRETIMFEIINRMELEINFDFETVHNYIDDRYILRKGAVSAHNGELLLIPINMRDGSLMCMGKGNPDWNYSAPHGAGRLFSRGDAKRNLTLNEFKKEMEGIYSTSVNLDTLDESPMAYKPMEEIISNIGDTVEIIKVLKPIYNFKAGG